MYKNKRTKFEIAVSKIENNENNINETPESINNKLILTLKTAQYIAENKDNIYFKQQVFNFIERSLNVSNPSLINNIFKNVEEYGFLNLTKINEEGIGL